MSFVEKNLTVLHFRTSRINSLFMKRSTKVTAETVAWGYFVQALAGAVALLIGVAVYFIFFSK
jgi:hypothetical protein